MKTQRKYKHQEILDIIDIETFEEAYYCAQCDAKVSDEHFQMHPTARRASQLGSEGASRLPVEAKLLRRTAKAPKRKKK